MTEGRGNAVREDDELDLEDEGQELGQINGGAEVELEDNTLAHEYPDDEPLSVSRQVDHLSNSLGHFNGSQETSVDGDSEYLPQRSRKDDDTGSIPDDSPSVQGSLHSSQSSSAFALQGSPSTLSPGPAHRPFDLRFQSRLSTPSPSSLRPISPSASLAVHHSRNSSLASQAFSSNPEPESDTSPAPWEVVRWTKLRKITGQAFSEVGKRNFGRATCIAVSTSIVVGTSKGIVLVFDYQQNLKTIIGPGTKAVESGAISSLAVSADHSTVAAGHTSGHIFTWEISKSARPFLHIPPHDPVEREASNADGHISGVSVVHIGFLGTRRTALVSADDRGMAFSHLATRGMGAVGRVVRTLRILGRYYDISPQQGRPRKPSSVLAFSPLPLGNIDQATDSMGLVAMLTPYLLVIVSTTPVAETQHKAPRPRQAAAHGAMTAALAWFPAIRLKAKYSEVSKTKLAYCWSNVLTVVEVSEIVSDRDSDKEKRPSLLFEHQGQWSAEESIVAVQWLSRSVLAVMTISQQLLILEQNSLTVTDSFDLIHKHIYHVDLFSSQLHSLVEQHNENDPSMHGVVADAFYMSFRAYKGRLFILGFNDISVGSLSNWADRLLALMESGDFIGAIRLATAYYEGNAAKLTVGLPEGSDMRHEVVQEKLLEMISASLKYAFGRNQQADTDRVEESQLEELADAATAACVAMDDHDFLFDEVYTWYEEHDSQGTFLDVLEHYIEQGAVRSLPPTALKSFITHFAENHAIGRLEEIICLLDTSTMDIDQATTLCKKHNLYDAFIYVWNRALGDYIGPLTELLSLVHLPTEPTVNGTGISDAKDHVNAMKIFPYLSYILTSRIYPTGDEMAEPESLKAKAELYHHLFSGNPTTTKGKKQKQPSREDSFASLRKMLKFDTASFMSMLNEAFEDSFLNETADQLSSGEPKQEIDAALHYALPITRQYIISILLEVMSPSHFDHADTIYLDMFIARNLPKYPQYILLSGTTLHQVLLRLCKYPTPEMADDCQLSVEYLLSMYHPPDIQSLIPQISEARFMRILKSIYRAERQFPELILTYLADDEDRESVFTCIRDCLQPNSSLGKKQRRDVHSVVKNQAGQLAGISVLSSARTVHDLAPDLHETFLRALEDDQYGQYLYLRTLLEPTGKPSLEGSGAMKNLDHSLVERYVQLMCQYNPSHVADFVDILRSGDLRLEEVLPSMEESGVIDAAVILLARQGQVREAMDRLTSHLGTLEAGLTGILQSADQNPDSATATEAVNDLMESLNKYSQVGTWLCQGQSKTAKKTRINGKLAKRGTAVFEQPLTFEENLWLDLIESVVRVARNVSPLLKHSEPLEPEPAADPTTPRHQLTSSFRTLIQRVFTALLTSTTKTGETPTERTDIPFLRILRTFLTRAAATSPSLSELRAVIASIFSAYTYEESLLSLANSILDKDLFVHVNELSQLRQRGWRPRGQVCEICRNRIWGPAAGAHLWEAWEAKQVQDTKLKEARAHERNLELGNDTRGKGKAISHSRGPSLNMFDGNIPQAQPQVQNLVGGSGSGGTAAAAATAAAAVGPVAGQLGDNVKDDTTVKKGPVVVFACRHLYHRDCLVENPAALQHPHQGRAGGHFEFSCVMCT
ncbi:Vacuolar protein sorting-associated protein 8 [Arachnomyces sp. PD_36]|nr:Vacuolar protein sorting-associated protein 8 [Arachnomyces sp. PD_36]